MIVIKVLSVFNRSLGNVTFIAMLYKWPCPFHTNIHLVPTAAPFKNYILVCFTRQHRNRTSAGTNTCLKKGSFTGVKYG
jgi:hypothetical protein